MEAGDVRVTDGVVFQQNCPAQNSNNHNNRGNGKTIFRGRGRASNNRGQWRGNTHVSRGHQSYGGGRGYFRGSNEVQEQQWPARGGRASRPHHSWPPTRGKRVFNDRLSVASSSRSSSEASQDNWCAPQINTKWTSKYESAPAEASNRIQVYDGPTSGAGISDQAKSHSSVNQVVYGCGSGCKNVKFLQPLCDVELQAERVSCACGRIQAALSRQAAGGVQRYFSCGLQGCSPAPPVVQGRELTNTLWTSFQLTPEMLSTAVVYEDH
ncbi:hypothetical protein FHG87_014798 [Trinorchestia longiramus]|nr:hypothetical protein FHG87_014798 [Trinorchestia longiramus]